MAIVYLQLGSDIGNRLKNLQEAVVFLEKAIGKVLQKSFVYETEPWQMNDTQFFLNQVVASETVLEPLILLQKLKEYEILQGRQQRESRNEPYKRRIIDLDILFYDSLVMQTKDLIIPHPLMPERRFVLQPLADLIPNFEHPVLKKTVNTLLHECADTMEVRIYEE